MKKIFDFKSLNTENFILDNICNWIEKKIHNFVVALLLTIVVGVSIIGSYIGFFVMPFISYSSMALKILFSVLWVFSCVVFICMTIAMYKEDRKGDKWGVAIITVCLIIFFGLCLINNNYYHFGDWWQIAIVLTMGLYTALMIYGFVKELIKNPKGTLSTLLMGIMFVFGFLCILSSNLASLEMDLRKEMLVVGTICIAFPIIAILIAKILKISKAEKVLEYGSLIILCILLLMGISYVISFLNPNVDGYQTFVTLFASFIGGGLTLIGVAWTIRSEAKNRQEDFDKREQERKEEERKKAKPIFTFKPLLRKNKLSNNNSFCLFFIDDAAHKGQNKQNDEKAKKEEKEAVICIQNSDNSNFSIEALYVDKVKCLARANNIVLKSQTIYIRFDINGYEKSRFVLECQDLLGNTYVYKLKLVEFTEAFYSLTAFKEIAKEEVLND